MFDQHFNDYSENLADAIDAKKAGIFVFFHIFQIFPLLNLPLFHIFHIISHFNSLFLSNFPLK
jgi:hypothetical protein